MKTKKKTGKIILVVCIAVVLILAGGIFMMGKSVNAAAKGQVNVPIDMMQVKDGSYEGASDGGMVKATVRVTVKDHKITKVDLLSHQCGTGKPAEAIVPKFAEKNTYDVDTVSGATISSRTIKNAVNNALSKGL